jgi:hypothetical protein
MPLHVLSAPAPALRCIDAALGAANDSGAARPAFLREAAGPLVAQDPLPVHGLAPEPKAGAAPRAELTGWRFLVKDGDERVVAAAETTLTPAGWKFSHFFAGPYLASTARALRQAEQLPAPHQPRLLSVPGLYMFCLWLHGDLTAGQDARPAPADVLIPLAPAPPGIAAHRPYRMADLLPLLTIRLTRAPLLGTAV